MASFQSFVLDLPDPSDEDAVPTSLGLSFRFLRQYGTPPLLVLLGEVLEALKARLFRVVRTGEDHEETPCAFMVYEDAELGSMQGVWQLPADWVALLREDPIEHLGTLLSCASDALWFSRGLFGEEDSSIEYHLLGYAQAMEAEFLWLASKLDASWAPTPYQSQVMQMWPQGVNSEEFTLLASRLQQAVA